ncbi:hypothetical protein [Dermabacter hominis]|uniref:hypothetical protein n=1 Tax=Dermabacter hominis TaxID=36740 RepID=UPI002A3DA5F6|nr:hypothetical protein [Dermabacter hominis]
MKKEIVAGVLLCATMSLSLSACSLDGIYNECGEEQRSELLELERLIAESGVAEQFSLNDYNCEEWGGFNLTFKMVDKTTFESRVRDTWGCKPEELPGDYAECSLSGHRFWVSISEMDPTSAMVGIY